MLDPHRETAHREPRSSAAIWRGLDSIDSLKAALAADRRLHSCAALSAVCLGLAQTAAAGEAAGVSPNVDSLSELSRRILNNHCHTSTCRADVIINEVVELQIASASATNGRRRPIPPDRDVRVAAAYRRLVRRSLPVAASVCREAATLLARFGTPGTNPDLIVAIAAVDLASRLDAGEPGRHCTQAVIGAMPATSAAENAAQSARVLCDAGGATKRCAVISR